MIDTLRDSVFGQIVNRLSGHTLLPYKEEQPDFIIPEKYILGSTTVTFKESSISQPGAIELTSPDLDISSSISTEPKTPPSYILADWYDENDPENPQNWSITKKSWIVLATGLLTISIYMGTSIFTPGIDQMVLDLNTTKVKAILPLTTFVIGYGIGPMILSPLSEHAPFGRTYIYIVTLAIFCVLQVPTALATTIEEIIVLRLIAGFFASPALSTGGATIGDAFSSSKLYIGLLLWAISAFSGPSFGPLVGGVLAQLINWRWTFWFLCIISGFSLCLLFFFLPETNHATILYRRAARLRKITGNELIKSSYEISKELNPVSFKELIVETFWRPIFIAFGEPMVFFLNLYCAFIYIIINSWFEAFPIVFTELYGFNLIESGVTYVSVILGAIIGGIIYLYWVGRIMKTPNPEIEQFLKPAMGGAILLPIGLFIFAWGASTHTHWIAPCIGALIFCLGAINIFH